MGGILRGDCGVTVEGHWAKHEHVGWHVEQSRARDRANENTEGMMIGSTKSLRMLERKPMVRWLSSRV